jgi:hypothetical protein
VASLEGASELPKPEAIETFDDLAKELPNLAGILVLGAAADSNSPSLFWTEFQAKMRDVFEDSFTEREVYLPM